MSTSSPNPKSADKEDFRMYYAHQYDRMKELEQQRLIMTNVIVGSSVITFSLAFSDLSKLNFVNSVVLPFVILIANFIAIQYNRRSRAFIKMHQERAHVALKEYAPELENLDATIPKPYDSNQDKLRRPLLQSFLHFLLMILSASLIIYYFWFRKP